MGRNDRDGKTVQEMHAHLNSLKPFLVGAKPLSESVEYLTEFARRFAPVCCLALVRLSARKTVLEGAACKDAANCGEGVFQKLVEVCLARLIEIDQSGGQIEDEELEQILFGSGEAPIFPSMIPVRDEGTLTGFIFVGKETERGPWTPLEKERLAPLATLVGISFANRQFNEEYLMQNCAFNAIMDSMRANLYVTDLRTDQILFMNKTMKEAFHLENPEGKTCWEVLQKGMAGRCPFCPVETLRSGMENTPFVVWEECNTLNGHTYQNYDSLMRWIDGSLVHFQQSIDITESKKLSWAANMDDLTNLFNRRAGKEALRSMLSRAIRESVTVTVCLFDINGLKEVNDLYGHAEGDAMLSHVAQAFQACIRPADLLLRLSGDEFVMACWNLGEKDTGKIVEDVRARLAQEDVQCGRPYHTEFCCGIFEAAPDNGMNMKEILAEADGRMYEQKRRSHIERAEQSRWLPAEPRKELEPFSFDREYLYDALVKSTDDYIYLCNMQDNEGTFLYPKAMVEEFALPGEVISNAAVVWGEKVHPDDKKIFVQSNQEIIDGRSNSHYVEYRARNRNGEWVWLRCRGHVERDAGGKPRLFAGMITNLGKKNRLDHVTGLYNKYEFEQEATNALAERPGQSLTVMILGLDEFQHINDLYNRRFGDEVLRVIAQKIQSLVSNSAKVYRLDGDVFCVLIDGSPDQAKEIYRKIHRYFSHQQEHEGKKYYCTLSAGCASYPENASNYQDLYKFAEYAMESAKRKGKNRIEIFSRQTLLHRERSLELTELLRESVENHFKGFEMHYQPVVNADSRTLYGAEALARWRCEKYGPVGPDEFIPLLEESGLIHPVGRWIFKEALRVCAACAKVNPAFEMSINLSYLQLSKPDFIPFAEKEIQDSGVDPNRIILELTESCIVSNIDDLAADFANIRKLHVRIAMDDFGTGYSSLEILKKSPADIVKVDRAFVKDISSSRFDATFIEFIVALCHDVDIQVCLEGIEQEEEYGIVKTMHLDFMQGYLFGKPVSEVNFMDLINNKK